MAQAIQQLVTLEYEQCCNCGVPFAFPDWMMRRLREKGGSFFCPNGHSQHYVETENTRLRKQLDEQIRVATEQAERARVAELAEGERRKELERLKKRIKAGTCPCCKRTFSQLNRHMKTKHPEFPLTSDAKSGK